MLPAHRLENNNNCALATRNPCILWKLRRENPLVHPFLSGLPLCCNYSLSVSHSPIPQKQNFCRNTVVSNSACPFMHISSKVNICYGIQNFIPYFNQHMTAPSAVLLLHCTRHVALCIAFRNRSPFVIVFFAPAETQKYLDILSF